MNSEVAVNFNGERSLKANVNRLCIGVLIYSLLMIMVTIAGVIVRMVVIEVRGKGGFSDAAFNEIESAMMTSGIEYIVAVSLGMLFLILFFRKLGLINKIGCSNKRMDVKNFVEILFVFMSVQCVFSISSMAGENVLNKLGFSMLGDLEAATGYSTTISMFLYASIIGPLSEELIFRGFVLRGLEKYGEKLAIVVSAVLFGAFHGNFIQGLFAFVVGLVLAYATMEYSMKWAMALHIINNCIFGDVLGYAFSHFSDSTQEIIWYIIQGIFLVGASVIIIRNRIDIKAYIRGNRCKGYRQVFSSFGMILFLSVMFMTAMLGIERI
ncbi:CPBP family intramembrane glutamic endopeptidase [Aminipila terrae]|uniref:CPBP family intramembrane metalloprotease n=1 Tax=Aminipila terrae TaxID=2697030 RepID=A0A6P1MEE5_9FIRM|nr:type II CAAX endopeptidase family protein [Aminipila terrae]QHI73020.1 CPBP family intramembrane metalloprotease [Aminipila terrae]